MASVRLAKKAYATLKGLENCEYKMRVQQLNRIGEQEFSLLLLWIRIEMLLKILRYYKEIQQWPDRLNFLNKRWQPLKRLASDLPDEYKKILENSGNSLWKKRDKIAHLSLKIATTEALQYVSAAQKIISSLEAIRPNKEALLRKKRNSDSQISRKKK